MCMTEFQVLISRSKKWICQSRENVKYIKIQAQNINEISDTMNSINYKQQEKKKETQAKGIENIFYKIINENYPHLEMYVAINV